MAGFDNVDLERFEVLIPHACCRVRIQCEFQVQHHDCPVPVCSSLRRDCSCHKLLFVSIKRTFQGISKANCCALNVALCANRFQRDGKFPIKIGRLKSECAPCVHVPQTCEIIPFTASLQPIFEECTEGLFRGKAPI